MDRVVDIATDGLRLAMHCGFLTVREGHEEKGRVALDDVGARLSLMSSQQTVTHISGAYKRSMARRLR